MNLADVVEGTALVSALPTAYCLDVEDVMHHRDEQEEDFCNRQERDEERESESERTRERVCVCVSEDCVRQCLSM